MSADRLDQTATEAWDCARSWAASGVMALCGDPQGAPLLPPLGIASRLSALVAETQRRTAEQGTPVQLSWQSALAGRAALLGLGRSGSISPNGSCRLLRTADGEAALSLPREEDVDLVAALIEEEPAVDVWEAVEEWAAGTNATELVSRARLLGLAAGVAGERAPEVEPYRELPRADPRRRDADRRLTVVDLSSLWAGPIAARILAATGARVIKVEDPRRPDGARQLPSFYSWLHPEDELAAPIRFDTREGRRDLAALLDEADVVIEASRPRALQQIGLGPEQQTGPPGQVWLSITAHGRYGEAASWAGFGDDSAVAGGLLCRDRGGNAAFCGDAIADPISGLVGALAVLRSAAAGGGHLLEVALSSTASWAAGPAREQVDAGTEIETLRTRSGWEVRLGERAQRVAEGPPSSVWIR